MQLVCLRPPASLASAFVGIHPSQRTWSNSKGSDHHPVGHTSNLLSLGGALPQLSPHTCPTGPCPWVSSDATEISILGFLYCTHVLIQAERGGCLLIAEWNYYLKISLAPAVPFLTAPITLAHRELNHSSYTRDVISECLCSVKNTCNTPGQRTTTQITPLRDGTNGCINKGLRSRSDFFILSLIFIFLSSYFNFSASKIGK